jgi:manganese efflux pump family protein
VPGVVRPASRRALAVAALAVAALAVAAVLPAAGCSAGQPVTSRATVASCYAFAVQALNQHLTVASVPPACTGLTHEQINLAVDRAIRAEVGPHRKAVARRLTHKEAAYLSYLVTVVPPRAPAPPAASPATRSSRLPLDLAALVAWEVTLAAGTWLVVNWIADGGLRRRYAQVAGVPRAVIVGHFTLALIGLGIWIDFMVTGVRALAWAAVAVVLLVAGLGMATLAGGLPQQRQPSDGPREPQPAPTDLPRHGSARTGSARTGSASTGSASTGLQPARMRAIDVPPGKPVTAIALHGTLASATILLVVLAAIGVS